jgi:hypothetical protein
MKLFKYLVLGLVLIGLTASCGDDDDNGGFSVEVRDPEEVQIENAAEIESFLQTHYFEFIDNPLHPNFQEFVFDSIVEGDDREPIIESDLLQSKQIVQQGVEYTLYYMVIREGNAQERKPFFSDSTFVTYKGITIDNNTFDSSPNPIWFDLTNSIRGFYELLPELRGSSGFVENSDGTVTFNDDFGIGVVFIPSGLAYFASPPLGSGILRYQPIIFSVQLYQSKEADHDRDGVPSHLEDVNNDGRVDDRIDGEFFGDDTDENGIPDFLDVDDDGDGVLTRDEISDEDGNIIFPYPDSNADGIPDYLDPDFPGETT